MGYDRGDSFPFDFEPIGIPFGLKSKGKLSPRSYPIQCERKWKYSFLSVALSTLPRALCRLIQRCVTKLNGDGLGISENSEYEFSLYKRERKNNIIQTSNIKLSYLILK